MSLPVFPWLGSNVAYDAGLSSGRHVAEACGVDRTLPVSNFLPLMFARTEPSREEAPSHQQRYEAFALAAELGLNVPNSLDNDTVSKNREYAPLYMRPRSSDCDGVWPSPVSLSRRSQPQTLVFLDDSLPGTSKNRAMILVWTGAEKQGNICNCILNGMDCSKRLDRQIATIALDSSGSEKHCKLQKSLSIEETCSRSTGEASQTSDIDETRNKTETMGRAFSAITLAVRQTYATTFKA